MLFLSATLRYFTWSLEVDASHLHGVGRVVGGNVCVVEQAFGTRLQLLSFAAARARRCRKEAGRWRSRREETHNMTTKNTHLELAQSWNGKK